MALLKFIRGNLVECHKKTTDNVTKSEWLFDRYILSDVNSNEHCLINNKISIIKKVINLYISYVIKN